MIQLSIKILSVNASNTSHPSKIFCQNSSHFWVILQTHSVCLSVCLSWRHNRCLQGRAPQCLVNCCHPTSDVASRQWLRSSSRHHLAVPRHHRSTLSRRAFTVAGPMAWNALPDDLRDPSLSAEIFRKRLKMHLFRNALGHVVHWRHCVMRYINLKLTSFTYWSSSLRRSTSAVHPQHSRTSGRRLIATWSHDLCVARLPFASC